EQGAAAQEAAPAAAEPPAVADAAPAAADGAQLYAANCAACHQPNGNGLPPAFPALAGSAVAVGDAAGLIDVLLNGRPGTAMASFARLPDAEIAAIATHVRSSWGNDADAVSADAVAAAR